MKQLKKLPALIDIALYIRFKFALYPAILSLMSNDPIYKIFTFINLLIRESKSHVKQ